MGKPNSWHRNPEARARAMTLAAQASEEIERRAQIKEQDPPIPKERIALPEYWRKRLKHRLRDLKLKKLEVWLLVGREPWREQRHLQYERRRLIWAIKNHFMPYQRLVFHGKEGSTFHPFFRPQGKKAPGKFNFTAMAAKVKK